MKTPFRALLLGALLAALLACLPAHALTIVYDTDGPLLKTQWLSQFVAPRVSGPIAAIADVDKGGRHRLAVRVSSKYFPDDNMYLYLAEFELQRRVVDQEAGRAYWTRIQKAQSWGMVPSEKELRDNIATLLADKVYTWQPD
jgi:hypothetical protein